MFYKKFLPFFSLLTMVVIALGSFTRLTDAGLGCPDWPGCYGNWIVDPENLSFVDWLKAWIEMTHRYVAGIFGVFILFLISNYFYHFFYKRVGFYWQPFFLTGLLFMQAALGMWTVTMKLLPIVVVLHLLGGIGLCVLLWHWHLCENIGKFDYKNHYTVSNKKNIFILNFGLALLLLQIFLGGWVSTNYAALVCLDLFWCDGLDVSLLSIFNALNITSGFGLDDPLSGLNIFDKKLIQMMHRLIAIIVLIVNLFLIFKSLSCNKQELRITAYVLLLFLLLQISLGAYNVLYILPLWTAVLHTVVAVALLISYLTMRHYFLLNIVRYI